MRKKEKQRRTENRLLLHPLSVYLFMTSMIRFSSNGTSESLIDDEPSFFCFSHSSYTLLTEKKNVVFPFFFLSFSSSSSLSHCSSERTILTNRNPCSSPSAMMTGGKRREKFLFSPTLALFFSSTRIYKHIDL